MNLNFTIKNHNKASKMAPEVGIYYSCLTNWIQSLESMGEGDNQHLNAVLCLPHMTRVYLCTVHTLN